MALPAMNPDEYIKQGLDDQSYNQAKSKGDLHG